MSEAPRHCCRCPGRQLYGRWKKTSVNVSLVPDSCAAGNKDGAVKHEYIFKKKKNPVEVEQKRNGWVGAQGEGELLGEDEALLLAQWNSKKKNKK